MSSRPFQQITRAREGETGSRALDTRHNQDGREASEARRAVKQSLIRGVAAVSVCIAFGAALTDTGAHANPRDANAGARATNAGARAATHQPAREIAALEARGFAPVACMINGTLMRNSRTGRSVVVTF